MVLWEQSGITLRKVKNKDRITVACDACQKQTSLYWKNYNLKHKYPKYLCMSCRQKGRFKSKGLPENHCINIEKTKEILGKPIEDLVTDDIIIISCQSCKKETKFKYRRDRVVNHQCRSCGVKQRYSDDPKYRKRISEASSGKTLTQEQKDKISKRTIKLWQDPEYRRKQTETRSNEEFRKSAIEKSKRTWADQERRSKLSQTISNLKNTPEEKKAQSTRSTKNWKNEEYRKKTLGKYYYETNEELTKRQAKNNRRKANRHRKNRSIYQVLKILLRDKRYNSKHPDVTIEIYHLLDLWHRRHGKCALSGIELSLQHNRLNTISIDRIDPNKGYIPGNIQLVCQFWNYAKHVLPNEDVIKLIDNYRKGIEPKPSTLSREEAIKWIENNPFKLCQLCSSNYQDQRSEFNLTPEFLYNLYLKQGKRCNESNLPILLENPSHYQLSIDRIDNSKGHIKDNIQLTCRFINLGKKTFSSQEVKDFLKLVKETETVNPKLKNRKCYDFNFKSIEIKTINHGDASSLIVPFHYLKGIGSGGTYYGAFLNNNLISACVYSHPSRKECYTRLGLKSNEMLELSRFVIHPDYQVKNLASYVVSRTIKLIKKANPQLKYLISFADTTHGHLGIIYRATNWVLDGIVKPNYTYLKEDGAELHKYTVYQQAKKQRLGELQYAEKMNYKKIWGKEKYRYLWKYKD